MRTLLVSLMVVLVSFGFTAEYAEAKKFGGGSSLGKSFSFSKQKKAPPPTQKAAPTAASKTAAAPAKKRGGFGGLMGGLLAGGLLAALFMGGGFDGIQFMDILLLVGGAFLIFKIISMIRQSKKTPQYATDGAQYELRPER